MVLLTPASFDGAELTSTPGQGPLAGRATPWWQRSGASSLDSEGLRRHRHLKMNALSPLLPPARNAVLPLLPLQLHKKSVYLTVTIARRIVLQYESWTIHYHIIFLLPGDLLASNRLSLACTTGNKNTKTIQFSITNTL